MNGDNGTVRAWIKYAASGRDEGVWSNEDRSVTSQNLHAVEVEIRDVRAMSQPPTLDSEGLTVVRDPLDDPLWADSDWLSGVYPQLCARLVQRLTGAAAAAPYYRGAALIRDAAVGAASGAPAARFVHLDQTPASAERLVREAFENGEYEHHTHAVVFNVWRVLSPPPQNTPLAICDQRTVARERFAGGRTVSSKFPQGTPYLAPLFSEEHRWYYASAMSPDEVIVFKGLDLDPAKPIGCVHGAFDLPNPIHGSVPRRSIETRVVALF